MAKKRKIECPEGQFGPVYNVSSPALMKFRRAGMISPEYGIAVVNAVLAAQKAALKRAYSEPPVSCASGCASNKGCEILKAVRAQQKASLSRAWMN